MKLHIRHYILLAILALAPIAVLAAGPEAPSVAAIKENAATFQWVLGIAILLAIVLAVRQLHLFDRDSKANWTETRALRKDLTEAEKDIVEIQTIQKLRGDKTDDLHFRRAPRDETGS